MRLFPLTIALLLLVLVSGCTSDISRENVSDLETVEPEPEESIEEPKQETPMETKSEEPQKKIEEHIEKPETERPVIWYYYDSWRPQGNPPECPDLILQPPVNLDLVSSILYPGQVRGGDYKPHGGFRLDNTNEKITVKAPIEGYMWRAVRYFESGELTYMFDVQHPCGLMYRFDHITEPSGKLQKIFDTLPEPKVDDSRTTEVSPIKIDQGEILATDISQTAGFDFGVYDLRKENKASQDPKYRELHKDEAEQAFHALCWLDLLPPEDSNKVKSLPGTGENGKQSDYCN